MRVPVFLFLAFLSTACASKGPQQHLPAAPLPPEGTYAHRITGFEFPETIGPFERTRVSQYDPEAYDVSGHYRMSAYSIIATVYHYPATEDGSIPSSEVALGHFESCEQDIILSTPGAFLIHENQVEVPINTFPLQGMHAAYAFDSFHDYKGPVESHLYLFVIGSWYIKFRFTHPQEHSLLADELEQEFMSSFRWPIPE